MSAFHDLLNHLPPERRAAAALRLQNLSQDENSPIFGLYAEVFGVISGQQKTIELAVDTKLAAAAKNNETMVRTEVGKLNPNTLWKRKLVSGTGMIVASIVIGSVVSAVTANHVAKTMAENSVKSAAKQEAIIERQAEMLDRITKDPSALVALIQAGQATAESVSDTARAIAPFARSMSERNAFATNKDGSVYIQCEDMELILDKKKGPTVRIGPPKNKDKSQLELDQEAQEALEEARRGLSK